MNVAIQSMGMCPTQVVESSPLVQVESRGSGGLHPICTRPTPIKTGSLSTSVQLENPVVVEVRHAVNSYLTHFVRDTILVVVKAFIR